MPAKGTAMASNKTPNEINVNGVTFREVNIANVQYNVASYSTSTHKGALVDRGANGGIAGEDVRIISTDPIC